MSRSGARRERDALDKEKAISDARSEIAALAKGGHALSQEKLPEPLRFVEIESTPSDCQLRGEELAKKIGASKKLDRAMKLLAKADREAVLAAKLGGKELAKVLCDAGFEKLLGHLPRSCLSDSGVDGLPLIVRAAQMGQDGAVRELLALGADPQATDSSGASALFHALAKIERHQAGRGAEEARACFLVAARLIEAGADALAPCRGRTPLGFLLSRMRPVEKLWLETPEAQSAKQRKKKGGSGVCVDLISIDEDNENEEIHRRGNVREMGAIGDLLLLAIEKRPKGLAIDVDLVDANPSGKSRAAEGLVESILAYPSLASAFEARHLLDACGEAAPLAGSKARPRL